MHDFVNAFLVARKKIPKRSWIFEVCLWVPLLSMNECREFDTVTNKKYGSVVSNHVPVPFFCVELDGESARISRRIGGSFLATDSRKAYGYFRFLSHTVEDICIGLDIVSSEINTTSLCPQLTISAIS